MSGPSDLVNGAPVPDGESVPSLAAQLRPAGPRAWAACAALGHNATREALQILVELSTDADWRYRRAAIEALASHPQASECAQQVCRAVQDSSPYVARTACRAAARIPVSAAHDLIVQLVESDDPYTREVAVESLDQLAVSGDFDRFLAVFRADQVASVRKAAAWALRSRASPQNWRLLLDAWISDAVPRHRAWACEIAVEFGGDAARSEVSHLASDADGHVRKVFQRLLGES